LRARAAAELGDVPFVCVVNKADLREKWEIRDAQCDALAQQGWKFFLASAKTGAQVEDVFAELARRMLKEAHVRSSDVGESL
jgi:50S ribosomal subunit-associated GTPase HflX